MSPDDLQSAIDDATFEFTLGNATEATRKLQALVAAQPEASQAWHALSEVELSQKHLKEALAAGERAHALNPNDLFINTTLSRIWVELGNKAEAEKFGAQAKMLSWKDQIQNPGNYSGGVS